jgi:hypothetical protein
MLLTVTVQGQQIHRNPFEGRSLSWQRGGADAPYQEQKHELTTQTAHSGQQSEFVQLTAEQGSYIHYVYPLGKADLVDELSGSVWIKANRPGTQFLARLVLPREHDARSPDQPMTTFLRGDGYQLAGRWQRLELNHPDRLMKAQQQLLQAELKRAVNFDGAYIDQLILNVYGGRGMTEVWIDDLEIGPIYGDLAGRESKSKPDKAVAATPTGKPANDRGVNLNAPRNAVIEMNHDKLLVNRKPFLVRCIRYSNTPLKVLKNAGFNALFCDLNAPEATLNEAVNTYGFWLVPDLPALEDDALTRGPGDKVSAVGDASSRGAGLSAAVRNFAANDAVLFWSVGTGLTAEQDNTIARAATMIRSSDPIQGRPVAGNVWDGFRPYSRALEMVGVHRWPLMTSLELGQYRDWLAERRQMAELDTYMWTWIQTHLTDWYVNLVYERPATQPFEEPIGPQPEQIRLLTYIALSAGYRGLGFWSDRFLANSHQGRDRLLAMALINQELEMLEPFLTTADRIFWVNTKEPDVKAAVMISPGAVLVLPMWLGKGAQCVPGQGAVNNLELIVPGAPEDAQVWEVSPGDVHVLPFERVAGGVKVVVPEFGLTTALLFTANNERVGQLQMASRRMARLAAQWSYELATEEYKKVEQVNGQLEQLGHGLNTSARDSGGPRLDSQQLLAEARRRLDAARQAYDRRLASDDRTAYLEAHRAMRPLRVLMRAHWEAAVKAHAKLITPVEPLLEATTDAPAQSRSNQSMPQPARNLATANRVPISDTEVLKRRPLDTAYSSPYALSFYTLPRHWRFLQELQDAQTAPNLLPNADFELPPNQAPQAWTLQEVTLDEVDLSAERVTDQPKEGRQCLKLQIKARNPQNPPAALERTFLGITTPVVKAPPGSLVQVSGWVRIPEPVQASVDGVLFFDSIGGEPLAVRLTGKMPWRKFTLHRRVPASGTVSVTMALTGIGVAYFDDVRVEPLVASAISQQPGRSSNIVAQKP